MLVLPQATQYLGPGSLGLLIVTIALLMSPAPFHQIVERGEDTGRVHCFATRVIELALVPFAGLAVTAVALFFWYGVEAAARAASVGRAPEEMDRMPGQGTPIKDKVEHVLTEARVVLPGTQALLGFQLAGMMLESFETLPDSSKLLHFAGLALIAVATVLLMTPAAWHRLVERGEDTERFHRIASRFVLAAMVPLALGLSADVFVVTRKVTDSVGIAATGAAGALIVAFGLWFAFTGWQAARTRLSAADRVRPARAA